MDSHADGLYRFALRLVGDRMAAEDLVQESFMRLWERREGVRGESAKSYLFTTLYHAAVDTMRRARKGTTAGGHEGVYELTPFDVQARLSAGLERLPAAQRSAIILRDYEGYSYREIGEMTSLSESQVRVYIHRGRAFLRRFLGSITDLI